MTLVDFKEESRQNLQVQLDLLSSKERRNQLGQFATPIELAREIVRTSLKYLSDDDVSFLDPAFGTGAFFSALLSELKGRSALSAKGVEIDDNFYREADSLWAEHGLKLRLADFTLLTPPQAESEKANLLVCNPPYVRHHHIERSDKTRLLALVQNQVGLKLSGLAGLYCYFLLLSHNWMRDDGIACWLVPSEFMDVSYGKEIRQYLTKQVTLLSIHRFDAESSQFSDALVSSAVVWFKKAKPTPRSTATLSFGGTLAEPLSKHCVKVKNLSQLRKWSQAEIEAPRADTVPYKSTLGDWFTIRRGLATGANSFFILKEVDAEKLGVLPELAIPILPSPRNLKVDIVESDSTGVPKNCERLFLLNCRMPESQIESDYSELSKHLKRGIDEGIKDRYLCSKRVPWYSQESREATPFLCTYMGRSTKRNGGSAFRFILNKSMAIATNTYLMLYAKAPLDAALKGNPKLAGDVWEVLKMISSDVMHSEGRIYGGGLRKVEPSELASVRLSDEATAKLHKLIGERL